MSVELVEKLSSELPEGKAKLRFLACAESVSESKLGRPTKYEDSHDYLILFHSAQGLSVTQIAVEFGVDRRTLYRWAERNESFRLSFKKGRDLSLSFYQDIQNSNLESHNLSMPAFLQLESILSKRYSQGQDMVELVGFDELKDDAQRVKLILSAMVGGQISVGAGLQCINAMKVAAELEMLPELQLQLDELKEKFKLNGE